MDLMDRMRRMAYIPGVVRQVLIPKEGKSGATRLAKEAFDEIVKRGDATAITLDIKGFFESLEQAFLYKKWCQILGNEKLPKDHQLIFKS